MDSDKSQLLLVTITSLMPTIKNGMLPRTERTGSKASIASKDLRSKARLRLMQLQGPRIACTLSVIGDSHTKPRWRRLMYTACATTVDAESMCCCFPDCKRFLARRGDGSILNFIVSESARTKNRIGEAIMRRYSDSTAGVLGNAGRLGLSETTQEILVSRSGRDMRPIAADGYGLSRGSQGYSDL